MRARGLAPYYMCKYFGEQCGNVTVPDADNLFRNTHWTHHEGSLNCYDGSGADASSWQARRSGVDLATCKAACLEEASCMHCHRGQVLRRRNTPLASLTIALRARREVQHRAPHTSRQTRLPYSDSFFRGARTNASDLMKVTY